MNGSLDAIELERAFARRQIELNRRKNKTKMPVWLKKNRDAYRDRMFDIAKKSYEDTGIWFLSRGAARNTDEQETYAVWADLFYFTDIKGLPCYSEENRGRAAEFWRSWQNLKTGRLYNPFYQDPQNPDMKRVSPGNRDDYSPDKINRKYIPNILAKLGAALPVPAKTEALADSGDDTFDRLWEEMAQWSSAHSGIFPVNAAYELDAGDISKIPRIEAGMGALLRTHSAETGLWRPEPLSELPWKDYPPSAEFKIISRLCGYVGMENFPEKLLKTGIDNLIEHKNELHEATAMSRNYGEAIAHRMVQTDYRREELLDAMESCLEGFRSPAAWADTGVGCYCVFGSGFIGAFMNWEELPPEQALLETQRFNHGCLMKWRFIADPYGNWINVVPKKPEEIFGHPDYDFDKFSLKERNKVHWAKKITELVPQRELPLKLSPDGKTGEGTLVLALSQAQLKSAPYLKAVWSGAYEVSLNGLPVKRVEYNMPDAPAGWFVPDDAAQSLRAGENVVKVRLLGPGKEQKPGAPPPDKAPFIRLGLISWQ